MIEYKDIKAKLAIKRTSLKYFTKAFFETFREAERTARENERRGIDSHYYKGHIYLNHAYDAIYSSDFYNKNSGTYCAFLEVYHEARQAEERRNATRI